MSFLTDVGDWTSTAWQDTKATAVGFFESVKEGDPFPVNPADYWSQKTGLDLHPSHWYDSAVSFVKDQLINILVIATVLFILYIFISAKAREVAKNE